MCSRSFVSSGTKPNQRAVLDRPIEEAELCSAIKTTPKNKSPGPDGWPAAFFQVAPETFAAILVRVFAYQRSVRGVLLEHQRRNSVTLLYKKGDRSDPGNYRPIALIPVEVKFLSRVLARRL
uniref:Reverse transcriptase domain-containing protein n=1 Tax=Hucho hucho TaxID=62062 RepID=A0A4W5LX09_9TELE